jgi:hypothetical protein
MRITSASTSADVGGLVVARLLGRLLGQADDGLDHRLEMLVAEHHGPEHHLLGQLLRLRLDHQDASGGARRPQRSRLDASMSASGGLSL